MKQGGNANISAGQSMAAASEGHMQKSNSLTRGEKGNTRRTMDPGSKEYS